MFKVSDALKKGIFIRLKSLKCFLLRWLEYQNIPLQDKKKKGGERKSLI